MMSACGVICSDCAAYHAQEKGITFQQRVAEAWHRIYERNETAEQISCTGCLGTDEEVFYTCRYCKARHCCICKGLNSCAECPIESCAILEKAQAVWDEVPKQIDKLTPADFAAYAQPYCGHRQRLANARIASRNRN